MFKRKAPYFVSLALFSPYFFAGGGVIYAQAACISGAQCEANGFSETETLSNDNFQSGGTNWPNAAVRALNGGTIIGDALTITTPNSDEYGVYVRDNGQVTLTGDSSLSGYNGVVAAGADSHFTMTGGSITASQRAIWLRDSGNVVLNNVDVVDTHLNNSAVYFDIYANGASFTMNGGSVSSMFGVMDMHGENNSAIFSNVTLNNSGGYAFLLRSDSGGGNQDTLTLNGGTTLNHNGGSTAAISVRAGGLKMDDAHIVSAGSVGISVLGEGANPALVDAQNFSIQATGDFRYGIQIGKNSEVKLIQGGITTSGRLAHGIWMVNDSNSTALTADEMTIVTSGLEASAIYSNWGTSTLTNSHLKATGAGGRGIVSDASNAGTYSIVNMKGGDITVDGASSIGVYAAAGGEAHLDDVAITGANISSIGFYSFWNGVGSFKNGTINTQNTALISYWDNASMTVENSHVTSTGNNSFGLLVQQQATASLSNGSTLTVTGIDAAALGFRGVTESQTITVHDSTILASGAGGRAFYASGGVNQLDARNATLDGDLLASVFNVSSGGTIYGANLNVDADNSILRGNSILASQSRLTMNLDNGTDWLLRPSSGGQLRSDVSFLNVNNSTIRFAAPDPLTPQFQMLMVGSGNLGGRSDVYNVLNNARIEMNTFFNEGGALADQFTDRLIVNGDVSGTTLIQLNAVPGGLGDLTGVDAGDGISLVQVYGTATAASFALVGGYVPVGAYEYRLHAFDPGSSDPSQRIIQGSDPFWDFRLLSGFGGANTLLPQAPSYLVAPNALLQAGLLDIGTLHQRIGENLPQQSGNKDFFLRMHGGDYEYHSNLSANHYGYDASTRYHAIQLGGNFHNMDMSNSNLRLGLAVSTGNLSFQPQHVDGSHKIGMDIWSLTPTLSWQHDSGAYLDGLVAFGGFKGDIANRGGIGVRLKGKNMAASIEVGMPFSLSSGMTIKPQMQLVYQHLKFDPMRDGDGMNVKLGTIDQWSINVGGEIGKIFTTEAGHHFQLYGKAHVMHGFDDGQKIWLDDEFHTGKFGTTAKVGLGFDAMLADDHAVVYGDVTSQHRLGRGGHDGWSANFGARVRF